MSDLTGTQASAQIEAARQAQLDDFRKNAAYNALVQTHGAVAGDPEAWSAANKAQAETDTADLVRPTAQAGLDKAQADTAAAQQTARRNNIFTFGAYLKNGGDPGQLDNPNVQKFLGISPDDAAAAKQMVIGPDGKVIPERVDGLLSAGMGPTGAMASGGVTQMIDPVTGQVTLVRGTKAGGIMENSLPQGATTPQAMNAQSGQQRAQQGWQRTAQGWRRVDIGQQNANTGAYSAGVRSNNSQYGAPDGSAPPQQGGAAPAAAPAPSTDERSQTAAALLKQYHNNPDAAIQNAPDDATAQAVADLVTKNHSQAPASATSHSSAAPAIPQLNGKPLATRTNAAQQIVAGQVNLDNANSIAGSMAKQITPYTTGAGSLMSSLPGSIANDLRRNAQTLKAQAAQAVLQGMKNNQGSTGIGRVLQAEYQNFTNMYGNMEQDQTTQQFKYHLGLLQHSLNKMTQVQRAGFQAQWKTDPESALGMEPRHASGSGPIKTGARLPGGFTVVKVQ